MEYTYLTVIERALDSNIVHVFIGDSGHLRFLYGRDAALRVEDEYRNIFLVSQAINSSTTRVLSISLSFDRKRTAPSGIPTGSSNNRELLPLLPGSFLRVTSRQEELEQVPQQLQRDVLERKRRSMEQLKHIRLVAQPAKRRDVWVAERAVRFLDQRAQLPA